MLMHLCRCGTSTCACVRLRINVCRYFIMCMNVSIRACQAHFSVSIYMYASHASIRTYIHTYTHIHTHKFAKAACQVTIGWKSVAGRSAYIHTNMHAAHKHTFNIARAAHVSILCFDSANLPLTSSWKTPANLTLSLSRAWTHVLWELACLCVRMCVWLYMYDCMHLSAGFFAFM